MGLQAQGDCAGNRKLASSLVLRLRIQSKSVCLFAHDCRFIKGTELQYLQLLSVTGTKASCPHPYAVTCSCTVWALVQPLP
jgi:hypothetical protein